MINKLNGVTGIVKREVKLYETFKAGRTTTVLNQYCNVPVYFKCSDIQSPNAFQYVVLVNGVFRLVPEDCIDFKIGGDDLKVGFMEDLMFIFSMIGKTPKEFNEMDIRKMIMKKSSMIMAIHNCVEIKKNRYFDDKTNEIFMRGLHDTDLFEKVSKAKREDRDLVIVYDMDYGKFEKSNIRSLCDLVIG